MYLSLGLLNIAASSDIPSAQFEVTNFQVYSVVQNEKDNSLTPNDLYMSRTEPLTSKRCILYIYSTNIGTEYFKHVLYSPFFSLFKMQFVS